MKTNYCFIKIQKILIPVYTILFMFISCDDSDDNNQQNEETSTTLQELAYEDLESTFYNFFNNNNCENTDCLNDDLSEDCIRSMVSCMQTLDFSLARSTYESSIQSNPNNVQARFGLGLTELLSLTQNQIFLGAVEGLIIDLLTVDPEEVIDLTPTINHIDVIKTEAIPKVDYALMNFDQVLGNDFTFTISGEMQGDEYQANLEMDDAEILLIQSLLYFTKSLLSLITSYDFDIDLFDEDDDLSWLNQNTNFLTLRNNDIANFSSILINIKNGISKIEAAKEFLNSEIDLQSDDVIPNYTLEDSEMDIDDTIDEINLILNGDYVCDSCINEEDITINISNFFNNPPSNLKALLPPYSIMTYSDCDSETKIRGGGNSQVYECVGYQWNANTYLEWFNQWPDPTFNGLLPLMDMNQFFNLIEYEPGYWKKDNSLSEIFDELMDFFDIEPYYEPYCYCTNSYWTDQYYCEVYGYNWYCD